MAEELKQVVIGARGLGTLCEDSIEVLERSDLVARLRESEERFRGMFEEAPVACHEIDHEGFVLLVNKAECELLGFAPSEMLGRRIQEFIVPTERGQSREWMRKMISGEEVTAVFERNYTRRDGAALVLEIHPRIIRDSTGHPIGIRSFTLDVTERRRAERTLRKQADELARSNAELEQFASVASHDLQEPLRKIRAFADRLQTKNAGAFTPEGRDYLTRMLNAVVRMQTLINDLLSLSRVTSHPHPFVVANLNEIAQTVVSDMELRIAQSGGRVEVGPLPTIIADRGQISQLLQNLIGNGLKFRKPGEAPVISVRGEVQRRMPIEQDVCQIVVEDNGIGFDQKYSEKIFRIFERLHGRTEYEGTGIGLAICRKVVDRHFGTISASSTPGAGATFTITLPCNPTFKEATQ